MVLKSALLWGPATEDQGSTMELLATKPGAITGVGPGLWGKPEDKGHLAGLPGQAHERSSSWRDFFPCLSESLRSKFFSWR